MKKIVFGGHLIMRYDDGGRFSYFGECMKYLDGYVNHCVNGTSNYVKVKNYDLYGEIIILNIKKLVI